MILLTFLFQNGNRDVSARPGVGMNGAALRRLNLQGAVVKVGLDAALKLPDDVVKRDSLIGRNPPTLLTFTSP